MTIHKARFRIVAACVAAAFCLWGLIVVPGLSEQAMDDSIVAKHVRVRIPVERQWLGRDVVNDLERCWEFVRGATGGGLPSRVLFVFEWQDGTAAIDSQRSAVTIGMANPAAAKDPKGFLLHSAARELSRFSLINLSEGGASRKENVFLLEGMSEMLAHDFANTVRRIGAAWTISYYLDRIRPLGLSQAFDIIDSSDGHHDLRTAAPGITFLITCREHYGRERVLKLFELLGKKNLEESLAAAFKTPAAAVEAEWLGRVRKYTPADITIATTGEAPVLDRITFTPDQAKAGGTLAVRLFTRDDANDLSASGIFVLDESTGKVWQGRRAAAADGEFTQAEIPIDQERQAGAYRLRVVAVDEGGNVRNWEASYSVAR